MADEVLGMFDEIPNEVLRSADVPSLESSWPEIFELALTLDGYETLGGFDDCAKLANRAEADFMERRSLPSDLSLTDLRCCLFFEQRRWRHFGDMPDGQAREYFGALLDAIRDATKS